MSIGQILYRIYRLEGESFVRELYRQILHREVDDHGLRHHLQLLADGLAKVHIICGIMQSPEAQRLYEEPLNLPKNMESTIAAIVNRSYLASNLHFVNTLYFEFLHRLPQNLEANHHIQYLLSGLSRVQLLGNFVTELEYQNLLEASEPPNNEVYRTSNAGVVSRGSGNVKRIGIFLGYTMKVSMEGEGIGRFTFRLVQGLLLLNLDLEIHIFTVLFENFQEVERVFQSIKSRFPNRLIFHCCSINMANQNIGVDVWLVPYAGMELAQYLQKPFVVVVHDFVHRHFKEIYYSTSLAWCNWFDRSAKAVAGKASACVFSSNYTREHEGLRFIGLPKEKTHVIRLAAPVEEYESLNKCDENTLRSKYNIIGSYIVFPSVIRVHKNHPRLIQAFIQFKQTSAGKRSGLQLVLTDGYEGRPNEQEIRALINNCHDKGIRNSIIFLKRIPTSDLPSLYRYAVGTIVPTLFEGGFPFPIMESLIVDTPVAISRIQVTQEVISNMNAFPSFDPYNVEEMKEAIGFLYRRNKSLLAGQKDSISGMVRRKWFDVAKDYYNVLNKSWKS